MARLLGVVASAAVVVTVALAPAASAHPDPRPGGPAAARNGQIAFGRFDVDLGAYSLGVAEADGRDARRVTSDGTGFSDWSPDGRLIAFDFTDAAGDVHLAVVRPDGTGRRTLTTAPGIQEAPTWSPDGRLIAYDAYDPAQTEFSTSIWVMRSDGTGQRRLTSDGFDVEPTFAPDGKRIAFGRSTEDVEVARESIHVVRTDGTGLRQVVPPTAGLEHPDWSPDGRWILFNIGPEVRSTPDAGSIFAVRPDGTGLRLLRAAQPHLVFAKTKWAPDGRELLSVCFDDRIGVDQLCRHRADGTGPVHRVPLPADAWLNFPSWGPRPSGR